MSLPPVIDIVLGVIFIYLILSLLASELHELLTTLMQWRADHLKRSIRLMLEGGGWIEPAIGDRDQAYRNAELDRVAQATNTLTDRLYSHPLINTLNHEATSEIAVLLRSLGNTIVHLCYKFSAALYSIFGRFGAKQDANVQNPFAHQASAPSYIPADTFAQTVVETFEFSKVGRLITLSRLEALKAQQLKELLRQIKQLALQESKDLATERLRHIAQEYDRIAAEFGAGVMPLYGAVHQMGHAHSEFARYCEMFLSPDDGELPYFLYQLSYLHGKYYSDIERQSLIASLKPDLQEVVAMVRDKHALLDRLHNTITDTDSQIYQSFDAVIQNLPELPLPLQNSLSAIAANVKQRASDLEDDVQSLQGEISAWFDKSMTRASGVYKRNARGIAILIGFLVAVATNADTLFIVDRLSDDGVLRTAVSEFATSQVQMQAKNGGGNATPEDMEANLSVIKNNLRQSLDDVALPLGWDAPIVDLQNEDEWSVPLTDVPLPWVKRLVGWSISAVAISMGASFWYDLLRKVLGLKVGNSGGTGSSRS